jgi:Protein of unknown function (DUF992)
MHPLKGLALLSLVLASAGAAQQTPSNIGVLTCTLVAGDGQSKPLSCGFKPALAGGEGRYVGTIRKGGASLTGKQILVWTVMATQGMKVVSEALSQRFSSDSRQPAVLVGQTNSAIMLQPEAGAEQRDPITDVELQLVSNPV